MTPRERKVLNAAAVVVLPSLACIFLMPDFSAPLKRSRRAEAKVNLRRLCAAELQQIEWGRGPTPYLRSLEVQLEEGNRYAYFLAPGGPLEVRTDRSQPFTFDHRAVARQVDQSRDDRVEGYVEAELPVLFAGGLRLGDNGASGWLIAAIGNIDAEPDLDLWSVATRDRLAPDGTVIPACAPFHDIDDTQEPGFMGFDRF